MKPAAPFRERQPVPQSLLDRLLRRRPAPNAMVELIRALNRNGVRGVTAATLAKLSADYGVMLPGDFQRELEGLYREYLAFCLADRRLSEEELADLRHLAELFRLPQSTCAMIQRHVCRHVYLKSISEVLADGSISDEEREFLRKLREDLQIPPADADNMLLLRQRQMNPPSPKRH